MEAAESGAKGKPILDVTCGARTMWFQKECPLALYMDSRTCDETRAFGANGSRRVCRVTPDVVADVTQLPFPDHTFYLVVFDPPHLRSAGDGAWLRTMYGVLPPDWPRMLREGFRECMRVLKPFGTLIFKWNETQIPTRQVIDAIGQEPLFGHRSGKKALTHWMCFMKTEPGDTEDAAYKKGGDEDV